MIIDKEQLARYISNWIEMHARGAKASSLIVGVSGGVDSALVLALCARTNLPTYAVLMPCHSSPESTERANELVNSLHNVRKLTVNLEGAFDSISSQVRTPDVGVDEKASYGALRSCLRAPTLDYVAKLHNGVIVGTGNRDEDEVTRYYQKRGDGAVDISPIAKLHKSEVYELAAHLGVPESILKATPSADLWGPNAGQEDEKQLGMTYYEIEQATRLVESMTQGGTDGAMFHRLAQLMSQHHVKDERLIAVLQQLGTMEKASKHKANPNLPVCNVRQAGLGFVE